MLMLESGAFAADTDEQLLAACDAFEQNGNVMKKPVAATAASQKPVLKRPAAATASSSKRRKMTADEKIEEAIKRRALKPAPFGRCPQWDCQDSLVVIPNKTKGADAFVGCPRQPDGRCNGYVRLITPAEYATLPKKLFRIVKLK